MSIIGGNLGYNYCAEHVSLVLWYIMVNLYE